MIRILGNWTGYARAVPGCFAKVAKEINLRKGTSSGLGLAGWRGGRDWTNILTEGDQPM